MGILETNRFNRPRPAQQEQAVAYPAVFHFRIIMDAAAADAAALSVLLADYRVTVPLEASRASSAGRYQAFSVSVEIQTQAELHTFDAAVKRVPGVRMVL